ncbi:MAG: heparinase II/III family protein [Pseudomonadota bacterium]|nr:heparinase II/III family protein [Pseudomonadota bacterium]
MIDALLSKEQINQFKGFSQKDKLERLRLRFSQRLLKKDIPFRLEREIKDPWPGNIEKARLLLQGCFDLDGVLLEQTEPHWLPYGLDEKHIYRLNNFDWLRDLKTLGGEAARQKGRHLIAHWIKHNRAHNTENWEANVMAMRVYNWLAFYEFFCASASDEFKDMYFESLSEQIYRLSCISTRSLENMAQIRVGRALSISGLVLKEYGFLKEKGLNVFLRGLKDQILLDGGHVSRSPAALVPLLCATHDVRMALQNAHEKIPLLLQNSIERMNNALRFFCYNDKQMALFHGTQEGDPQLLSTLLSLAGNRQRMPKSMPQSGFERIAMGRSLITIDVGGAPEREHDEAYHASALAFEYCYGKQRIITNCGTHPYNPQWKQALRRTAAHNTAEVKGVDSAEIRESGHIGRKPLNIHHENELIDGGQYISAVHDGYLATSGVKHYRQIGAMNRGKAVSGQDHFESMSGQAPDGMATIRFHLHPTVRASLTRDKNEILLSLPGGTGFRFYWSGAGAHIEDSIYFGRDHTPQKTNQIILNAPLLQAMTSVEWLIKLEELH